MEKLNKEIPHSIEIKLYTLLKAIAITEFIDEQDIAK